MSEKEEELKENRRCCVQCGHNMIAAVEFSQITLPVCDNPKCPNYGLLQMGTEAMKRWSENKMASEEGGC